ncbi:MAG: undecaprenyldiphospho-muramoylpentapeptide beta-N-acetylglucosaminyltransferase [Clostridia bacterium]|nr:undecaprenyldiphospho-muramoylpentapeptide beta-N-acetylglucosaminyltransferase [Clostridia bacterium]
MATLVLTGGGTAGHCIPHLALLPYLSNDFDKIYYIGSPNGLEKNIVEKTNIEYYSVPCVKLKRSFSFDNFSIPFKLTSSIIKAGKLLDKLKPDVIFSKGGYVSLPTVIAGSRRKIPVISHESDLTMGLANKLSSKYSRKILTSFPDTATENKKFEYVGSPIRKELFNPDDRASILKSYNFDGKKPILLVMGGSLGAKAINDAVRNALPELTKTFDVIHACGKGNLAEDIKIKGYFQTEFINKIQNAFSVCSVAVTRAGANSLFELLCLNIPSLVIPLPKGASRGDQIENADYFLKKGVINLLSQENLTEKSLLLGVLSTYSNKKIIEKNLSSNPIRDCSRKISRIIADYKR